MEHLWDVVVMGAGMGGITAALSLSEAGFDVLLVDRGVADAGGPRPGPKDSATTRLMAGHWPERLLYEIDGVRTRMDPAIGIGIGGSTLRYAGALERLLRDDIDAVQSVPRSARKWPISFEELAHHYRVAERLFEVSGTSDPLQPQLFSLKPPRPTTQRDADLFGRFKAGGLHPYRSHLAGAAMRGSPAPLNARHLLDRSPRPPQIRDQTIIERLNVEHGQVIWANTLSNGKSSRIQGRYFILAAGALHTPKILMSSRSEHHPQGLCNGSGLVGRNLMFHALDMVLVWPGRRTNGGSSGRAISSTALAQIDGRRGGALQSMGIVGSTGMILHALRANCRMAIVRPLLRACAHMIRTLYGRPTMFCAIIEDLPQAGNRVQLDEREPGGVKIVYNIPGELHDRVLLFRKTLRHALSRTRTMAFNRETLLNFGHPCGTCTMGDDPLTSVVDADCRSHEIANLYISDASVFPTSGRANPSLTVAAIGLRVGARLVQRLRIECAQKA